MVHPEQDTWLNTDSPLTHTYVSMPVYNYTLTQYVHSGAKGIN